jgi:hypothetical protein
VKDRRVIMPKGRPEAKQSLILDRFIKVKNLKNGKINEEFPVGIRKAHSEVGKNRLNEEIHERLEKCIYKFGHYANDVEMLNAINFDWIFGRLNLSKAFGWLVYNAAKSIDAVYINGKEAWIIEIKTGKFERNAIDQVLEYAELFREDYPNFEIIRKIIVTEEMNYGLEPECKRFEIEIYVV